MSAKRNLQTAYAIFEMIFFTGVVFGWANMLLILKDEEYFQDLCEVRSKNDNLPLTRPHETSQKQNTEKCSEQDEQLALVFTVGLFAFNLAGLIGGALVDKFGTRIVRLLACAIYIITNVLVFIMKKETAYLMFPTLSCLAIAGMFLALTDFQVGNLHRKHQFHVTTALSGALDSSTVVFLILKVLYDVGLPFRWLLVGYTGIAAVLIFVSTLFLYPEMTFVIELESMNENGIELGIRNQAITPVIFQSQEQTTPSTNGIELGIRNQAITPDIFQSQEQTTPSKNDIKQICNNGHTHMAESSTVMDAGTFKPGSSSTEQTSNKFASGWRYMLTGEYLWVLYFHSVVQLRIWFYVASLNSSLIYRTNNNSQQIDDYSRIFGIIQFFGFFLAPLCGPVVNLKSSDVTNPYFGPMMSYVLTLVLSLLLGGLALVPELKVQYLTFAVQVTTRAFLYASMISYILKIFPAEHYGKLYGSLTFIAGLSNLLQYPAIILVDGPGNGNPFWIDFGFLVLTVTTAVFPGYLWFLNRNAIQTTSL